jgi:hypothetical protein
MAQVLDVLRVRVEWGKSSDDRPAVVVRVFEDGALGCALVSSQFDLFDERADLTLSDDERGFAASGLKRTSYVTSRRVVRVKPENVLEKLGSLVGDLHDRFVPWWFMKSGRLLG